MVVGCDPAVPQNSSNTQITSTDTLDHETLEDLFDEAEKLEFLRSFLVWNDSGMVAERYYQSYPADSLDHVRSVTKSIISILTGIAIDQGLIESVNDPVKKYLGSMLDEYSIAKQEITIRHLLTMSAGFQWNEGNDVAEFNAWSSSRDPTAHLFSRQLVAEPGSTFSYNSGLPHLLSIIITETSGMSTKDFANQYLFEPLNIGRIRWRKLNDGYYSGGASLEIAPSDLMRIGVMMLNQGVYGGKRIVSAEWVETSVRNHMTLQDVPGVATIGYGYLWWTSDFDGAMIYQAKGYGGQYLVIVPQNETVVTITSQWQNLRGRGGDYLQELDQVLAKGSMLLLGIELPKPPGN